MVRDGLRPPHHEVTPHPCNLRIAALAVSSGGAVATERPPYPEEPPAAASRRVRAAGLCFKRLSRLRKRRQFPFPPKRHACRRWPRALGGEPIAPVARC